MSQINNDQQPIVIKPSMGITDLAGPREASYSATELLRLAASEAISPEEFERELWAASKGHVRRARQYRSGDVRIYRTRVWDSLERPKSVSDLSYPPKDSTPLNRANLEGEPVFYASAGLPASFVECRLERGQHVACAEWRTTIDVLLQEVGLSGEESIPDIEKIYEKIFRSTDPKMYRFSARVARHLLSNDRISGLLYPSIAAQNGSHNLALKTGFVDAGLQFVNASLYFIKDITTPQQYQTEEIDFALPTNDGSLDWKGRGRQWVLRKQGDRLKMVSTGWSYDAYDLSGALIDPE